VDFLFEEKDVYWISVILLRGNVIYVALPRQNYAEPSAVEAVTQYLDVGLVLSSVQGLNNKSM